MVKLGAKSPYVTSTPKSSRCSTCYKPPPTPIPPIPSTVTFTLDPTSVNQIFGNIITTSGHFFVTWTDGK